MAGRVMLYYFNGRGKMVSIRWLLTVAEVEDQHVLRGTDGSHGQKNVTHNDMSVIWRSQKYRHSNPHFFPQWWNDCSNTSFEGRMTQIPAIKRFLLPGSKRKPQPDATYAKTVMEVFKVKLPLP